MVYSLHLTYYNGGMDEKQLSIEQVEKIMGWSYPTALKFANRHGEMVGGKWQIPSGVINEKVSELATIARYTRVRFEIEVISEPANA